MDEPVDFREIDPNDKPDEFVRLSPDDGLPMLADGEFVLSESQMINDYLVEELGWEGAYAGDRKLRYRQKYSMHQWDSEIMGPAFGELGDNDQFEDTREDIMNVLEYMNDVVQQVDGNTESLFAYHFAPFWARIRWLEEFSELPSLVRTVDGLFPWLDRAVDEPAIQATLPDRDYAVQQDKKRFVE